MNRRNFLRAAAVAPIAAPLVMTEAAAISRAITSAPPIDLPAHGAMRLNTDTYFFETFDGGSWHFAGSLRELGAATRDQLDELAREVAELAGK